MFFLLFLKFSSMRPFRPSLMPPRFKIGNGIVIYLGSCKTIWLGLLDNTCLLFFRIDSKTEKVHIEACLDLFESSQKHVTVGIFKSHLHKKLIYVRSSVKVLHTNSEKTKCPVCAMMIFVRLLLLTQLALLLFSRLFSNKLIWCANCFPYEIIETVMIADVCP